MTPPGEAAGQSGPSLEVRVRVPASSANLGPGFDALGLALDLNEEILLRRRLPHEAPGPPSDESAGAPPGTPAGPPSSPTPGTPGPTITVRGTGAGHIPADENLLAYQGVLAVYRRLRRDVPPLALELENRIPRSGGLGGSAAAVVGGAVAANALEGYPLGPEALLEIATALEGHPDNAARRPLRGAGDQRPGARWTDRQARCAPAGAGGRALPASPGYLHEAGPSRCPPAPGAPGRRRL